MTIENSEFSQEDIEIGLQMLKQYHLKELVREKGLAHTVDNMGNNEQLREALLPPEYEWSLDDFEELLEMIEIYKKESEPLGHYIAGIRDIKEEKGLTIEKLKTRLEDEPAVFDEDHEDLEKEGFNRVEINGPKLSGIYWTQSISYSLNPLRELDESETIYATAFEIDTSVNTLYIDASLQSKADQLINKLVRNGLSVEDVGHGHLMAEDAKEHVGNFVRELKEKTRSNQSALKSYQGNGEGEGMVTLKVYSVGIMTKDEKIERVDVDGSADIFGDEDIRTFINDRGGKIIRLEGKFDFNDSPFGFSASYDPRKYLGRLSVKKEASPSGNPDIVDDCFEFLADSYRKYYIDFE